MKNSWILGIMICLLLANIVYGLTDEQSNVVLIVAVTFGTVSFVCSFFTLLLIYYSKKWTGYLLLLVSLTVSQMVYDINYIFRIINNAPMCRFTMFMDIWGGLGISFWVNILSFVVAYTVVSSKPIQIFEHYYLFSIYGTLIPIVAAAIVSIDPVVLTTHDSSGNVCTYSDTHIGNFFFNLYYWGRLGAICLTIFFCIVTFIRLRTIRMNLFGGNAAQSAKATKTRVETRTVFVTVSRMNYYAFAQVLCRSGAAWNEWNYGQYSTFESNVAAAICSPSTGILSFLIFLMMQPNAYKTFIRLITCRQIRDEDDEERFKVSNSVASSSKASSVYDSHGSRASSGVHSVGSNSQFGRDSQDAESQYDTPNPIFLTTSFNQQDDWYEDEDIILARWISVQRQVTGNDAITSDPLVHPSQRVKTSSAVYARLMDYSTDSDSTFPM